jgi:predicted DNA-binding transcriptional regulator AlpA
MSQMSTGLSRVERGGSGTGGDDKSARYLRTKAVAARYGIHERTVPIWVAQGRLPKPYYKGRFPLYLESELDAMDRSAARERRPAA